jgi:glycosyltransferase involved in cell wall biosynthesis
LNVAQTKVLHILPHVGGGVGSVLRAFLKEEMEGLSPRFAHSIAALETLNEPSTNCFNILGIPWRECVAQGALNALVENADMVLVHWWNHPLLMRLLFEGLPPVRLAFWSHVNGYAVPQAFFRNLFEMPDLFIFATQASFDAPAVKGLSKGIREKLRVIRSCAGVPKGSTEPLSKEGPFQIGYVGTVEPAKMHPDFLSLCAAANLSTPCIVAGGPSHHELRTKAEKMGLGERFEILGPINDPQPVFRRLHAFAYPLTPNHYGTGEQVLVEAMAFGAVPVVLANPPEKALVLHAETGLVVENAFDFSAALRFLADHPVERERMAAAGRRFVMEKCPIKCSQEQFHAVFEELFSFPKRSRQLSLSGISGVEKGSPFHLFLSSCGNSIERKTALSMASGQHFDGPIPPSFSFSTRGAPAHYLRMLGHDPSLERICKVYGAAGNLK